MHNKKNKKHLPKQQNEKNANFPKKQEQKQPSLKKEHKKNINPYEQ